MKKIIIAIFIFLPFMMLSQKQIGRIAENVQSTKIKPGKFKSYQIFKSGFEQARNNYSDAVKDGVIVTFDKAKVAAIYNEDPRQMEITLPFKTNGETITLELYQKDIFSPDFKAMTSDGQDITDSMDRGKHYRGMVNGKSQSLVSISIFRNEIIGFISYGEGNYSIGRLKDSNSKHIIYKDNDLRQSQDINCSMEDDGIGYTTEEITYSGTRDPSDCVNVYIEAGQSVFNSFGGNLTNTTNFLNGVFGQSFVLYANEGITMQTSSMLIWTTPDPYIGGDTGTQLSLFQANTGAFTGDIGHLVEVQNIGGLAAGFSGICNPVTDNSLCFSGFSGNSYNDVPTVSFNAYIITHEMGHLLGSRHTHACVWNGNNTAIDSCSGFTEGGCALPGSPAGGGTIMSYCINDPVGLDFTQGFGPQPGAVILNTVNTPGNCLVGCSPPSSNDLCGDAINMNYGDTVSGSTTGAIFDNVGTCVTSNTAPGVWYTFTGDGNNTNLSTCNQATYDTKISVFTGSCASLTCETGQDDATGCAGFTTSLDFCTTNGTLYYVLVHGFSSATGDFDLTLTSTPSGPAISCPGAITQGNDVDICGAVVTYTAPVGTDDCPGVTTTQTAGLASGDTFPLGTTTNTFLVTDAAGLTATCSFDVTVNDTEAPEITCPADITQNNDTGVCGAVVTFSSTATDNCPGVTVVSVPASGSTFPVGTTMVTSTATDAAGLTASCTFNVTVNDMEVPNAVCIAPFGPGIFLSEDFSDNSAGWTLDSEWEIGSATTSSCTSGDQDPSTDNSPSGDNGVAGVNIGGCSSTSLHSYYFLTSPVIDVSSSTGTLSLDFYRWLNSDYTPFMKNIVQVWDGTAWQTIWETFGSPGNQDLSWSNQNFDITAYQNAALQVRFGFNVASSGVFSVSSWNLDDIVISSDAVGFSVSLDNTGQATINVSDIDNGSSDNCGIDTMSISPSTFTCADVGLNDVTLTVTDIHGNVSSCTTQINVVDDIDPTWVNAPTDLTVECDGSGNVTQFNDWLNNTFTGTDNCPNPVVSNDSTGLSDECGNTGFETVTFTLTDASGNAITLDATFTIEDTTPPSIDLEASDLTVECDGAGNTTQLNDWLASIGTTGVATDDCAGLTWSDDFTALSDECGNTGAATVIFTATDECGLTNTTTATFTIVDTTPPSIDVEASDLTVECDGAGNTTQLNDWLASIGTTGVATDDCAGLTWSDDFTALSDECGNTGAATVIFTATDECGLTNTTTATFTIEDTTPPSIDVEASDLTVECDGAGNTTQLNDWLASIGTTGVASDDCAGVTWSDDFVALSDGCGETGSTTVTFTATDECGLTNTTTATFTIEDTTPAVIGCPGDVTAFTEDGDCGAIVNFQNAVAIEQCGSVIVYQTAGFGSGSVFPVGDTTIEFTAQDECGNLSTCEFIVTVIDDDAPEAICQSITVELDDTGNATITANQVNFGSNDNCGVDTLEIDIDTFDCSNVGDNDVILTVTDVNGNVSTCTAVVTVVDVTAPEITCNDITIELDADGSVTIDPMDVAAGSSDACGIATYELNIDTFGCLDVGNNTVILTVTDVNGNESSCTANVTVEDNMAPELVCMDVTLELNEDGIAYVIPSQLVETINDPCGVLVFTADVDQVSCSDIGTPVTVNIFANDGNGNSSFCSATVTVVDVLGPQIVCPDDETVNLGANGTYILGDYIADGTATATDNCTDPVTIFSQDPAAGTALGFGVHVITFTAEDEYGNVSTCSFELDVEEILGANDTEDFASLVLYPNPADHQVHLSNPTQMDLSEVTIYDLTGRIVNKVDLSSMGSEITIDVSTLANAPYLLVIKGSQGTSTKTLIVNNY